MGDLPPQVTSEELAQLFSQFAAVVEVKVIGSQGYAFVTFLDPETAMHVHHVRPHRDKMQCCYKIWETPSLYRVPAEGSRPTAKRATGGRAFVSALVKTAGPGFRAERDLACKSHAP